jgi:hypothetical protein
MLAMMTLPRPLTQLSAGPEGNAPIPIQNVTLQWHDPGIADYNRATSYHVTVSPAAFVADVNSTTSVVISTLLLFGTEYDWTVQGANSHGVSRTASASFRTMEPPPPTNLSPSNNASNIVQPVTFNWVDAGVALGAHALQFDFQISGLFPAGTPSPQAFVVQATNFTLPFPLLDLEPYTWQVSSQYNPPDSITGLSVPSVAQFETEHMSG